ncbi:MAG: hypothetical protein H6737_09490 [Alphaproteobacteria bacterium]|nr:hypothetical protein [Alphaproteobacteria bacterium]
MLVLAACDPGPDDTDPLDTPIVSNPAFDVTTPTTIPYDDYATYTITGVDDRQAYRITLVHADYVSAGGDGSGTFQDNDANGAADPGASEAVALITNVNGGDWIPGYKTVPGVSDDPANPTGIWPEGGQITLQITGIGSGTIYPVVYHNGGASTFLEVGADGTPIETYAVGGSLTVEGPDPVGPVISPDSPQSVAVDGYYDYTISGLSDTQAYRITLVHADNLTTGPDQTGTFIDEDANGAADAGPSENVASITQVNGADVPPAKTVPAGTDDPASPTGVFPVGGQITVRLTGVGEGTVYPVAYYNGGASTFLEIDTAGSPIETYAVGGSFSVTP